MAIRVILCASVAAGQTLERISASGVVKIAHRTEARPFSYFDETGAPTGYTLALCDLVVGALSQWLGMTLRVAYVPVAAETRFAV